MARSRNPVPKYTLHKSSGQARVCYGGREYYLGKHGSPESLAEYARVCAEIGQAKELPAPARTSSRLQICEVATAFFEHAEQYYRGPGGKLTSEFSEYKYSVQHLWDLYGQTLAAEFGPIALQTVRAAMVKAGWSRLLVEQAGRPDPTNVPMGGRRKNWCPWEWSKHWACVQGVAERTDDGSRDRHR